MYNHAPVNYVCPICLGVEGIENTDTLIRKTDIVYKDELVTALVNSFFVGSNSGHIIIVPNEHFENIYDLPTDYGNRIFGVSQKIAVAMKKAYECDGTTIRQNNEPASEQHAFHYHLHVFPRYNGDEFNKYLGNKQKTTPEERMLFAEKLKKFL